MLKPAYSFDPDLSFVIEQYNDRAPFASFLPGIAGCLGIPAWVFYVNRGQAIASFGVRNKDGAFLEFFPADKAYQLTASRGFRTFLKIAGEGGTLTHEPFQRGAGEAVRQRMIVTAHEVGIEEIHPGLGLAIRVDYFTLAQAPVAGLVRRVCLTNTGEGLKNIEIVDGLPQVLPYGMNQWVVKFMSRTVEAYMRVEGVAECAPFYRLKVLPTDSPLVEKVEAGNFFVGLLDGRRNKVLVDAERVFGLDGGFSKPERFYESEPLDFEGQVLGNRTPAAFQALSLALQPQESRVYYGVYGHAGSWQVLQDFLRQAAAPDYFEAKREANRGLVEDISRRAFTATARPLFDAYASQCFLDNGLRGGFTAEVPGGARLHLFGRKHGDLERDYNDFLLQDSPFSEGNGDFRDMLQNRRTDIFFDLAWGARDIRYFFNLIQPDGYNPCSLRNTRFVVDAPESLARRYTGLAGLEALLAGEFKYAQLWRLVTSQAETPAPVIQAILAEAREIEDAEFDRGYWSDHWTYLLDLLESYAALFPDRLAALLEEPGYTFFDPTHRVLPRAKKFVMTPQGLRQYGSVQACEEKQALIDSRPRRRHQVRAQAGKGAVVETTLLGKILTLVLNKLASLDPFGVGIEMEADRPGWCDALNGLPGLLGSAVNETCELKRLADFTHDALAEAGECPLPVELAEFLEGLAGLMRQAASPLAFWQASHDLKEAYRERVFMGFEGGCRSLPFAQIRDFLRAASVFLDAAIAKAKTPAGILTYFQYDAEEYRQGEVGVAVTRFRQTPLPLFLEGFVHAMRIAGPEEARRLYRAVNESALLDHKLRMYRLNAPLGVDALELGRIGIFNDGWLENGSIFLHMHAKFVLEMVRCGLLDEFYAHIEGLLVSFRDPLEYRRSPIENSSFIVSSGFAIDPREHGRGCVARLSGATVEFLHLWLHLFLGAKPFAFEQGRLLFRPEPSFPAAFFSKEERRVNPFGLGEEVLPADSVACALFGNTLLVYRNPARQDSFGPAAASPRRFVLHGRDGSQRTVEAGYLEGEDALALRDGQFRRVDVSLGG